MYTVSVFGLKFFVEDDPFYDSFLERYFPTVWRSLIEFSLLQ